MDWVSVGPWNWRYLQGPGAIVVQGHCKNGGLLADHSLISVLCRAFSSHPPFLTFWQSAESEGCDLLSLPGLAACAILFAVLQIGLLHSLAACLDSESWELYNL